MDTQVPTRKIILKTQKSATNSLVFQEPIPAMSDNIRLLMEVRGKLNQIEVLFLARQLMLCQQGKTLSKGVHELNDILTKTIQHLSKYTFDE